MRHPLIINLVLLSLSFNLLRTPMHWRDLFTAYAKNLWHVLLFYRPNNKIFQRVNVMAIRVCCTRIHAIISPHMAWPLPTQRKNHGRLECACVMVSFSEKNSFEIHFIRRNSLTTRKRENVPENGLMILLISVSYWLLKDRRASSSKVILTGGNFSLIWDCVCWLYLRTVSAKSHCVM